MMAEQRYTMTQIADALRAHGGFISDTAVHLGCAPMTVRRYIARYPALQQIIDDERERVLDVAERANAKLIAEGHPEQVRWFLGKMGRKRGYTDKTEVELSGPGGGPIRLDVDRFLDALAVAEAGTFATPPATPGAATDDPH
jgi:hypothetical protein